MLFNQKIKSKTAFGVFVLLYLFFRIILFKGFNGTDDLHYAMYAADMLNGKFNPFIIGESISGRVFLIGIQALMYKIGGIGILTTQLGTLLASIGTIHLVLFKILDEPDVKTVSLGSALFFGNLVMLNATLGILPDSYIMLVCTILFIILRKSLKGEFSKSRLIQNGLIMGSLSGLCLLIKENSIIFVPVLCIVSLLQNKKKGIWISCAVFISFVFIILLTGWSYWILTDNFFFKLYHLKTGGYDTDYTHDFIGKNVIPRLSYVLWLSFIISGFYPVVFAIGYILGHAFRNRFQLIKKDLVVQFFIILVIIACYFPVHLFPYLPLPPEPRHFLFLLPFATVISIRFILEACVNRSTNKLMVILGAISLMICVLITQNKWQWMLYGLITLLAYFSYALSEGMRINKYILLPLVFWFGLCEGLFFLRQEWFGDSVKLHQQMQGLNKYFPDNDNYMHWKLFDHFDKEENHLILFLHINDKDSIHFKPGWIVVNKEYTICPIPFLKKMDSLRDHHFFPAYKQVGVVYADSINSFPQLKYIFTKAP